jgi:hypothetical protein
MCVAQKRKSWVVGLEIVAYSPLLVPMVMNVSL